LFKYEPKTRPLASRRVFYKRLAAHAAVGAAVIAGSLVIGVLGYHGLAGMGWIDAILNASMILGGMGPIDALRDTPSKLFASAYALYSGCMLLISVGVLFAPVVHRIIHRLHMQTSDDK
jgi:hypothetical protein